MTWLAQYSLRNLQNNHDNVQFEFSQKGIKQDFNGPQAEMGFGNTSFSGGNWESAGTNLGRQACETEKRAYGLHIKERINEWLYLLQRVPRLRWIRGLGSESLCVRVCWLSPEQNVRRTA